MTEGKEMVKKSNTGLDMLQETIENKEEKIRKLDEQLALMKRKEERLR
jgi:hypothetical protein